MNLLPIRDREIPADPSTYPICFIALEDESSVSLNITEIPNLSATCTLDYSYDNETWTPYTPLDAGADPQVLSRRDFVASQNR